MENSSGKKMTWHLESLPLATKKVLDFFSKEKWLQESSWYLAGGTALALQTGHRMSVDLDFFTTEANFEAVELLSLLPHKSGWRTTMERTNTIYGEFFGSKVSFIAYPFFIPLHKQKRYGFISVLQPIDLAVMKIIAVSQRGKKRDFFDLYWSAHHIEPLEQTIGRLKKQYPSVTHNYHHILKSLIYFADAENDPEPEIYFKASWSKIKNFFKKEISQITPRIIGLE